MQYVISAPLEKLFAFGVSRDVLKEFAFLMDQFRGKYIDREFKSLEILDVLQVSR